MLWAGLALLAAPSGAATVKGKIVYEGEKPKLPEIKMDADPVCLTHHEGAVYSQAISLNDKNEIQYVFVHIAEGVPEQKYPVPAEPFVVSQKGCLYDPPMFGVLAGQEVKFLNPDGTLHNVHAQPKKNPEFNIAMPKFRKEVSRVFEIPELMIPIKCDVHPWMLSHLNVMEHPFFSTSNQSGDFEITDLPPGNYVLEALQQRLPPQKVEITVTSDDEIKEVNFTFTRPGQ
jgi:plastocyanin